MIHEHLSTLQNKQNKKQTQRHTQPNDQEMKDDTWVIQESQRGECLSGTNQHKWNLNFITSVDIQSTSIHDTSVQV